MVRLRNAGLSSEYRRNRQEAGIWFLNFISGLGLRLHSKLPPRQIDRWLEYGVQKAYEEGIRLYYVTLGVLALQQRFRLSGPLLRNTWLAVKGWRASIPSKTRVPISCYRLECLILSGLGRCLASRGLSRKQWLAATMGWWLGFVCLLRPGELLNLRRGDINLPEGDNLGEHSGDAVVIIRRPKTRRIWREQFVLCSDSRLVRWLSWWLRDMRAGQLVLGISRYIFVKKFLECCSRVGLESCHYTLGSLRAGGATHHFQVHKNLGELQFLGRWSAASTLQHYLMEAFSAHVTLQASDELKNQLSFIHEHVELLNFPPTVRAQDFVRSGRDDPAIRSRGS